MGKVKGTWPRGERGRGKAGEPAKPLTHQERLALINKPIPLCGKPGLRVMAYPWAGTIVSDRWFEGFSPQAVRDRERAEPDHRNDVDVAMDEYVDLLVEDGDAP